jgi:hypothetical protein
VQGFDCNVGYCKCHIYDICLTYDTHSPFLKIAGIWGLGGSLDDIAKRSLLNKRGVPMGAVSFAGKRGDFGKRNNAGKMCELSFGINRNAYIGDIAWLDIPTCDYGASPFWKTKLTCVKIDGVVDFKFNNTLASFDTSVKYIEAPHDDVAKIHEGLGATYNENSKQYEFDCCNAKDLKFSFEKYDITIPVSAWTSPTDHSGKTCTVKLSVSKSDLEPINKWQLGTSFIENFYSIFNYDSLQTGLALSVNGLEGLKITSK